MKSPFIMFAERRLLLSIVLILGIYEVGSDWGHTNDEQMKNKMFKNLASSEFRPKTYKRLYTLKVALLDLFRHIWNREGGWKYQQIWETNWAEPSKTKHFTVKMPDWKKGPKVKKLCMFSYEDYYTTNKSRLMTRIYRKLRYDNRFIIVTWLYIKHQGLLIETITHPYFRFRSWAPAKRDLAKQIITGNLPDGHIYKIKWPSINLPYISPRKIGVVAGIMALVIFMDDISPMLSLIGMIGAVYVSDINGNDGSADPTNPATPLKTLLAARALDTPGQTTYVDRLETIAEYLIPNSSGTFANRVIYNGRDWAFGGGGTSANHVLLDNGGTTANMLYSSNTSYRTYEGIDFANATGGQAIHDGTNIFYITFDTCVSTDAGGSAFAIRSCSYGVCRDCIAPRPGNGGFTFNGTTTFGNNNCSIINCIAYDGVTNDGGGYHQGGGGASDPNGDYNIVYGGSWYGMPEQGFDLTSGDYSSLYGMTCHDNGQGSVVIGHDSTDNDICYNHFYDEATQVATGYGFMSILTVRNRIYNNLLETQHGTTNSRIWAFSTGPETHVGDQDNYIHYNTTLVGNNATTLIRYSEHPATTGGPYHVTNNIFVFTASTAHYYVTWSLAGHPPSDDEYDYNTWNGSTTGFFDVDDGAFTLAEFFTVYGNAEHSQETDPLVISDTGAISGFPDDAKLQAGSPCIGQASPITTGSYIDNEGNVITGITVDYNGNYRGGITDMGGFEFLSGNISTLDDVQFYDIEYTCDI